MSDKRYSRRTFIRETAAGGIGMSLMGSKALSFADHASIIPKIRDYRRLGRTNILVSDIGSGIPYSQPVLKAVIDSGVNFIETSETYDNGRNEILIGNAIRGYERDKIFITTKINTSLGLTASADDIIKRAEASLNRLDTPYIDLYMMHQVQSIVKVADKNFHNACDKLKKAGKIKFRGLSCHGTFWWKEQGGTLEDILIAAVDDGRYDVLFFPYNFLDSGMGERVIKACKSKDIGTMIMKSNPVSTLENYENILKRGEKLGIFEQKDYDTKRIQMDKAEDFLKKYRLTDTEELKKGAYRFILSNKDVSTVCCRFRNFSDIETYIALSGTTLDSPTSSLLHDFRDSLGFLHCRFGCNLCEINCPDHVPVNAIMRYIYYLNTLNEEALAKSYYAELNKQQGELCKNCSGLCEKGCPHNVAIRPLLADAHTQLSKIT